MEEFNNGMYPPEKPTLEQYGSKQDFMQFMAEEEAEHKWIFKMTFLKIWGALLFLSLLIFPENVGFLKFTGLALLSFLASNLFRPLINKYVESQKSRKYKHCLSMYQSYLAEQSAYEEYQRFANVQFWRSLGGLEFEKAFAALCEKMGYNVTLTPPSGDEGVDVILRKDGKKIIVQCKAHSNPVGPAIARELYGSLFHHKADEAWLIALAGVTYGVKDFIKEKPIRVFELNDVIQMYIRVYGANSSELKNLIKTSSIEFSNEICNLNEKAGYHKITEKL